MPYLFLYGKEILIVGVIFVSFMVGYQYRGMRELAKVQKAIIEQTITDNKISGELEKALTNINSQYENIDMKVTYEVDYNCVISADGLRLIRAATK